MNKKFQINGTKIKGSCQSGRKVVTHDSKSDFPLHRISNMVNKWSGGEEMTGKNTKYLLT